MFIQTEPTPNPRTIKFLPGQPVMISGTAEFKMGDDVAVSPLASKIFSINDVRGVFFGSDFISVTIDDAADWQLVRPMVLAAIMDHYTTGMPVINTARAPVAQAMPTDDISRQIVAIIDERVRPAVAQDGGDIVFDRFEDGVVYLHMRGACSGCPSSTATLKNGIENMLKHFVPEVAEVRAVAAD
jgi:Fe-S cluster biogenesis protein NfuA